MQGITLSPNQVKRASELAAERGLANVSFQVMNALEMEFDDGQFDLVWACESGEHMPDKTKYGLFVHKNALRPLNNSCCLSQNAGWRLHGQVESWLSIS
eukprot:scaffold12870_cov37-Prasinocladus_malaysianus.AAC.1